MISSYAEYMLLKRLVKVKHRPTIKEALEAIQKCNKAYSERIELQINRMLNNTEFEKCNKILKELV